MNYEYVMKRKNDVKIYFRNYNLVTILSILSEDEERKEDYRIWKFIE